MNAIVDRYDAELLDHDGVLYRGTRPLAGAADAVAALRARGIGIVFVTNNASRTPEQVAEHLGSVGVAARPEEIETSALVTATTLAARGVERALVVGQDGLLGALDARGIASVGLDGSPEVVVVGLDRGVTYDRLRDAALAIQRGASFIAANPDTTFPAEDGNWPGAGARAAGGGPAGRPALRSPTTSRGPEPPDPPPRRSGGRT
ncbi:MAG: HAD-IIA family hydrolase [Actinomycetota bacterium]